ncbi:magnesium and cobalt transport protein CorA [Methylobacterium sp. WL12]|uniref:magnesium and cobalt transport protein CorA n=1 Tax=Methylobacterium sp. WL12 TaxID=2603890 RepID=UPI002484CD36|nr:magnesium and cobalt transport protein CorA [Methylobacterium sp. WL12]
MVASGVYAGGRRVADIRIDEAGDWARRPGHVVWIGLYQPSMELLVAVQGQFGLHRLAIEDARHAHQRPKVERYGDGLFVVVRTAQLIEARIALGETQIFVGRGYIVTVRHGASASYAPVREKTESCPRQLAHGEDYILHAVLDFIVDNYRPVMETVMAEVEAIEDRVLKRELLPTEVERLYLLRRDLLRLRSAVVPFVEVCRKLEHDDMVAIDEEMQPLFRDVSDHLRGVQEEIDAMREVLAFAFEASLMLGQAQQTAITRKLAAWAAILAVPTAIAGIYGMNFEGTPGQRCA